MFTQPTDNIPTPSERGELFSEVRSATWGGGKISCCTTKKLYSHACDYIVAESDLSLSYTPSYVHVRPGYREKSADLQGTLKAHLRFYNRISRLHKCVHWYLSSDNFSSTNPCYPTTRLRLYFSTIFTAQLRVYTRTTGVAPDFTPHIKCMGV